MDIINNWRIFQPYKEVLVKYILNLYSIEIRSFHLNIRVKFTGASNFLGQRIKIQAQIGCKDAAEVKIDQCGYFNSRKVYQPVKETRLVQYIIKASNRYFVLSLNEIKGLVFDYASQLCLLLPQSWLENKISSKDWL